MGLDQRRRLGIDLDLLAQARHLIVDAAVEELGGAPHRQIEKLVAAQDHAGMIEESAAQPVFGGRERLRDAVATDELTAADIEAPSVEPQLLGLAASALWRQAGDAAEH